MVQCSEALQAFLTVAPIKKPIMQFLHAALTEHFECAGRLVSVTIVGTHDDGRPVVEVRWSSRPDRMTERDCTVFDQAKRAAIAALQVRLAALQERST